MAEEGKSANPSRKRGRSSMKETACEVPENVAIRPSRKRRNAVVAIGSYVRKNFPGDGAGTPFRSLLGKVLSCCGRQYTIVFEDGRREALNLPETRQILLVADGHGDSEEFQRSKRKLEQLCCTVVTNAPRTRSRKNGVREEAAGSAGNCKKTCQVILTDDSKEAGNESGSVPCNGLKKDEVVVEALDPVEVASSSMPSSNLDDDADDGDSCSDSCDMIQLQGSRLATENPAFLAEPLPPSSGDINVPEDAVSYLFNTYSFLRSFSHQLFLCPFGFDDFVGSLNCTVNNNLLDAVHLSLLRTLRRHLEALTSDGSKLASMCLKCIDWNLLDMLTWPVFLVQYFLMAGHVKQVDEKIFFAGALEGEYYSLPVSLKLSVLQILCDDVLESAELGTELATRENLDEDKEYDVNPDISSLESGPKRVHPRYSKTSACKNPGSLEETITTDELISSSKGIENDAKDSNVGQDGNSDDCRLCGMEGTLVCCDGCPSAYHSRCIGLNKASLPDGPWYCPECTVRKMGPTSSKVSFGIRGAELFGSDPFGRMYLGTCDYLLVLEDSFKGKHISRYYNRSDVTKVLQVLFSTRETSLYASICKAILIYWEIPSTLYPSQHYGSEDACMAVDKNAIVCFGNDHIIRGKGEGHDQVSGLATCNEENRELPPQDSSSINVSIANSGLMDANSQGTESFFRGLSSGRSLEDPDKKNLCLQQKAFEDTGIVVWNGYHFGDESSKSAGASSLLTDAYIGHSNGKGDGLKNSPIFKPYAYINQYIPGEVAASAAANFAIAAAERNKILGAYSSVKERKNLAPMSTIQLKAFSEACMHFLWPSTDKKIFDVPRERCGWCLACEAAATCKKGCLLNLAVINTVRGYSRSLGNFRPLKNGSHLSSIAAYILYMEASLSGLLEGPFLDAYHNVHWRKFVSEASTVGVLKYLLLEFEKNISEIVFSNDFLKPLDDWSSEVSDSQNGACLSGSSQKRSIRGRRGRKRSAISESNHSDCDDNLGQIQWWCGGRFSKFFLRRGALPALLAKKAARQGGSREVSGVLYNMKIPSMTREAAWRAAVEKSKNYSQLAFQVRYLDAHLRWRDLFCSEPTSLDGKVVDSEASAFRNASVVDEKVVESHTQYALAFGDQKHLPLRIMKNVLETEQCIDGDKLWFSKNIVPLYLIKEYEEKKVASCMASLSNANTNWLSIVPTIQHNSVQEDIFSYLFHKGEKHGKISCSSCKGDVLLRHAFKCQNCGGHCHRNCLKASTIDMKEYMCTLCYNANPSKKDVGNPRSQMPSLKCQIPYQQVHVTPDSKIREHVSLGSLKQPANIEENPERSVSANVNPERKNKCLTHGLIWKGKKGTESCDPDFRTKHIILKGDVEMGTFIAPKCKLCLLPYNPNLMYISCEKCNFWYHAESVQLGEHQVLDLVGFKCPTCRRRCAPICPYWDPNSKKRQMRRNETDGKQRRAAQIASRTSSETPESVNAVQCAQVKIEDTVVPPGRVGQVSAPMSEVPLNWAVPKAVKGSKGKLPVRRHASNDIPTDANAPHTELMQEPLMLLPAPTSEIKQEVDLEGFSTIQEANSATGVEGTSFFKVESDFPTTDENMDVDEINENYQLLNTNDDGTEGMEYEPQTYFSFTELLASGDEQLDEMFDVDIPVEVPDDWHPTDPSGFDGNFGVAEVVPLSHSESDVVLAIDNLECQKCRSNQPPPDLSCEICGLTIHSHCSPWVEKEEPEDDGEWRCGSCREWR